MTRLEILYDYLVELTEKGARLDTSEEIFSFALESMKRYAEDVIRRDRINIAENIKFQYGEMDVEGVSHREIVDVDYDSIIYAPQINLD